ncbi:F0F1 ATP synthase subunit B [Kitasatospora sp. NPDC048365]|uniref:F0F1 ATP synthase subunit B family protein n=1 Tax=Kitasatospora sp. NPDC048365 TaxID=3364050 RepID=UPI0037185BC7
MDPLKTIVEFTAEAVVGLSCFLLVFLVLGRGLLPRVEQILAERRDATEGRLARAEQTAAEAERALAARREELSAARLEAAAILQAAAAEGAGLLVAARAEGQRQRAALVADGRARIDLDRELARVELQGWIGELSVDLAGRVIGEPLHEFTARQGTVERFLDELTAD